jgi:hypothetical protein
MLINIYKLCNDKYIIFICGIISVKYLFINKLAISFVECDSNGTPLK